MKTPIERFEEKYFIEPNTGCWLWTASTFWDGYPQFGDGKTMVRAHRFSYAYYRGEIPNGLSACHKCDTPICVNPDHLFLGTPADNMADCRRKDRVYKKLNNEKILDIRRLLASGRTHREIAVQFGISSGLVSYIKNAPHYAALEAA